MNNSKNGKMYIGILVNLVTSLIGVIVWYFNQDSIKMASSDKNVATMLYAAIVVPAVLFYALWYMKGVKALASATDKIPSFVPYLALSAIVVVALTVVATLVLFDKAVMYAAIAAAVSVVGSLISYLVFQP